jgi:hypothetical protein
MKPLIFCRFRAVNVRKPTILKFSVFSLHQYIFSINRPDFVVGGPLVLQADKLPDGDSLCSLRYTAGGRFLHVGHHAACLLVMRNVLAGIGRSERVGRRRCVWATRIDETSTPVTANAAHVGRCS